MLHITFYFWHWHEIQSHQFGNPFFGTLARPFHFRQWLRICAVKIGASYFCNLFSTCQEVLGHACHIWYSLGLKTLTYNHSTRVGPVRDPLCHDGQVRQEVKRPRECPEELRIFYMDLKNISKFRSLMKSHDLMCNIIKIIMYSGSSQMLRISLKTEKNLLSPTPDACCPLLALSVFIGACGNVHGLVDHTYSLGANGKPEANPCLSIFVIHIMPKSFAKW